MAKRKYPSEQQCVAETLSAYKNCRGALNRKLCKMLAKRRANTKNWVKTKIVCAKAAGRGWSCQAHFDCLARVGAGSLPLGIIGEVIPSKLCKMSYKDAMDILGGKKFKVRDDGNPNKTVTLAWQDMSVLQESRLIGKNGAILPVSQQPRTANPKAIFWDAEGLKVLKHEVHAWYYNNRGRRKVIVIPRTLLNKGFKRPGRNVRP